MKDREFRQFQAPLEVREIEDSEDMVIEGRFITFNEPTELFKGCTESIAPSVAEDITGDIRALINHDFSKVIGRTSSGTLELRTDATGVWGTIKINPNDTEAVNLYERVKRRDVTGCSFGFDILEETEEIDYDNNTVHYTIKSIKLYEVSIVTFPVYEGTNVQAREKAFDKLKIREFQAKKSQLLDRLSKLEG